MLKKKLILPWTLAGVLFVCLVGGIILYQTGKLDAIFNKTPAVQASKTVSSGQSKASATISSSNTASQQNSADELTALKAKDAARENKYDIELAAAQTQLMNSQSVKSSRLENEASYVVSPTGKYVYLTFDDGPSENTPGVLEILKKNNVKATFFVIYNKNKDYYRQIVADGQTLALHTYTHDYKQVYASVDAYFSDLDKISAYVKDITGIQSTIVRLPGGSSNTISRHYCSGVMTSVTNELQKRGYSYYDWNAQCLDATTAGITPAQILKYVKSFTEIGGVKKPFIMLLMHNASTETTTKEALQSIIDYYRAQGYQFEVITRDTPAVHQVVQN